MYKYLYFIFFIAIIFSSCTKQGVKNNEKPLARVLDKYLYPSDIQGLINSLSTPQDSERIVNNYIDKWIRTQLLLAKAELHLTPEQKDVKMELEDYRSSLLIYRYEQDWITKNLDTLIDENEMKSYYDENINNFILQENILKALFIKVDKNAPNIDKIKQLYKSSKADDIATLNKLCFDYATKYDSFGNEWISFETILMEIPYNISDQASILRNNKNFEYEDDTYLYLIKIKEYKLKGESAPFNYIKKNIKQILLNKRKIKLIDQLENNIFNDALNYGYVEKYKK
jgi:hypothetical protein